MTIATLVLENGMVFQGDSFGANADSVFELVFNTSMTGYQEVLTDPSYRGQGVLFTSSHVGNVGINQDDFEAQTPQISAVVVRSISSEISNWRAKRKLPEWLKEHGVPGISGIDTRMITRALRDSGTMKAAITTNETPIFELVDRVKAWPGLDGLDMVKAVTCKVPYFWEADTGDDWVKTELANFPIHFAKDLPVVILYDFGSKWNIARHLAARGLRTLIVPADVPFEELKSYQPAGIILSNGPGDPAGLPHIIKNVQGIIELDIPVFGICLGHQLIGLALGGVTKRLKFGHHGGNHPVYHLASNKTLVTSQNHNYTVDQDSLDKKIVEVTHLSLNDRTVEGLRMVKKPVFSVQFHPEGAPGPHDAHNLFDEFFAILGL